MRKPGGPLGEAALSLYGLAGRLGTPLAAAALRWRERHGKEDAERRHERLGHAGIKRPPGPLIWVHAASVGETVATLPLLGRLAGRGINLLLTTGTVTAAQIAAQRLPEAAIHQFVPIDTPGAVGRFLNHWRPSMAIFAESELWPTMLKALERRATPLAVVNARLSERSFRSWRRMLPLARAVMGRAQIFLAQTAADARRLEGLGASRVVVCGNLKFDAPPPPADEAAVRRLREEIGERSVLVAASTHPGEEEAALTAHAELAKEGVRLLTILAPRHPARGSDVAELTAAAGLKARRRSCGERVDAGTDVYLADTIGEMGLWYRLADLAFLGGSLVSRGGQNPIEPAKLNVPILTGPHVGNFRDVYDALTAANAVTEVTDSAALAVSIRRLIGDCAERKRLTAAALASIEASAGALDRTLEALQPYLAELGYSDAHTASA